MFLMQHDVTEAPRCLPRTDNKRVLRLPGPQQLEGPNSRLPNEPSGNARPVPDGSFRGGQNRLEPLAPSVSFVDTRWVLSRSLPQINHCIVHRDSFAGSPLDRMLKHAYRP